MKGTEHEEESGSIGSLHNEDWQDREGGMNRTSNLVLQECGGRCGSCPYAGSCKAQLEMIEDILEAQPILLPFKNEETEDE